MADEYMQAAFDQVIADALVPEDWYVTLVESVPFYGGPEEGGWWGEDTFIVKYKKFPSHELAEQAANAVRKLAKEMTHQAQREYGQYCLNTMEMLDARGLDADYLPEPDGPTKYYVTVTQEIVQESRGCRQYS